MENESESDLIIGKWIIRARGYKRVALEEAWDSLCVILKHYRYPESEFMQSLLFPVVQ